MPARYRITNQLRRLRFDAGEMTQQELAEKAGVTRQTIIAIEAEKYSPSLELAFRLAAVFRKPLEEVFRYERA
jgi:putative transcriptional regulator